MTFVDAHSPSAVCTPTRYALVTGRYCWRSKLKRGVLNGYGEPLIDKQRSTLASVLKSAGYDTGVVGKWHLGLGFAKDPSKKENKGFDFSKPIDHGPNDLGWDYSFVIPASLDFPPYIYIKNHAITQFPSIREKNSRFPAFWRTGERAPNFDMADCLDRLTKEAKQFIATKSTNDKPFFLYFPLTAPHKPVYPHPRFRGTTELGPYGDFVTQVDSTVGDVLRAIDDAGIRDNTLVIYTSDNGSFMRRNEGPDADCHVDDPTVQAYRSDRHTANSEFRGTKADIYEAGHRVPFFVRWPKRVGAGIVSEKTICHVDCLATLAEITNATVPKGQAVDSHSFLPQLDGKPASPRPGVINHSGAGMFAIREGNWKLIAGNGSGGRQAPKGKPFARPYQLYDLESDIAETKNLIESHADIAARLEEELEAIRNLETTLSR
jgi:arylsulfatase A-like enzyme